MTPNTTQSTSRRIEPVTRVIKPVIGWGPTAFNVQLTPRIQAQLFAGTGWITEDGQPEPIGTLEQFLDLQREHRVSF